MYEIISIKIKAPKRDDKAKSPWQEGCGGQEKTLPWDVTSGNQSSQSLRDCRVRQREL